MCGRFVQFAEPEDIAEALDAEWFGGEFTPNYNVAPSQNVLTVLQSEQGLREVVLLRWGLLPSWSREPKVSYSTINARAETVAEKPMFRQAFRQRRCLIPANGFYEWRQTTQGKQPYYIHFRNRLMVFAGLWEHWERDGVTIESCTIIVTSANPFMQGIHDRMPVILPIDAWTTWLTANTDPKLLQGLLQPYPLDELEAYPVSKAVNSPRNNQPDLMDPVAA